MTTCGVTALRFLTIIAICIAGLYAQSGNVYNACGINQCMKCSGVPAQCVQCNQSGEWTLNTKNDPPTCDGICPTIAGCQLCDKGICLIPMEQWGISEDGSRCERCDRFNSGCTLCTNTSVCIFCGVYNNTGPKYDNTATCGSCGANCAKCSINGAGFCDRCSDNSYLVPGRKVCVCSENCDKCSVAGYSYCDTCLPGYGVTTDSYCKPCDVNCSPTSACNKYGDGTCDGPCKAGYGLDLNGNCQNCPKYCDNCDQVASGKCYKCQIGYVLSSNSTTCDVPENCASSPCQHGGVCRNTQSGFSCACNGYIGDHCETPVGPVG